MYVQCSLIISTTIITCVQMGACAATSHSHYKLLLHIYHCNQKQQP